MLNDGIPIPQQRRETPRPHTKYPKLNYPATCWSHQYTRRGEPGPVPLRYWQSYPALRSSTAKREGRYRVGGCKRPLMMIHPPWCRPRRWIKKSKRESSVHSRSFAVIREFSLRNQETWVMRFFKIGGNSGFPLNSKPGKRPTVTFAIFCSSDHGNPLDSNKDISASTGATEMLLRSKLTPTTP